MGSKKQIIITLEKEREDLFLHGWKKIQGFGDKAPQWRIIGRGLNLFGTCTNQGCDANDKEVICQKSLQSLTNIKDEFDLLQCPMCLGEVEPIYDLGFFDCKYHIKGMRYLERKGEKDIVEIVDEKSEAPNNQWVKYECKKYKWKTLVVEVIENPKLKVEQVQLQDEQQEERALIWSQIKDITQQMEKLRNAALQSIKEHLENSETQRQLK